LDECLPVGSTFGGNVLAHETEKYHRKNKEDQMLKTMDLLGKTATKLTSAVAVVGLVGALALPAAAGADSIASGSSLVFANGKTEAVAGNVAVPVECLGSGTGFCSGNITLSRSGHRVSIPFSVENGSKETVYVPLHVTGKAHAKKVHGVATTVQPQGAPTSTKEFLYAE
jgi:hypothetical protein